MSGICLPAIGGGANAELTARGGSVVIPLQFYPFETAPSSSETIFFRL